MGNRHILLVFSLGILLCGALLYGLKDFQLTPPVRTSFALIDQPLDSIEHISVNRGAFRVGLVRQDGHWILTAPFPAQVDQGRVLRMLDAFESARVRDTMSLQELNKRELSLGALGLQPSLTRVALEGRGRRMEFLFGKETPSGQEVYVRLNDASEVLVLPASLSRTIPRTADDIRSRRLVPDDSEQIQSLEIRSPGLPFIKLVKTETGWNFNQPVPGAAAGEKVKALLLRLCTNSVVRFEWPTVSNVMDVVQSEALFKTRLGLCGLDPDNGVQLQIFSRTRTSPVQVIFGNAKNGERGLTYALLHGSESIGLVPSEIADAFRLRSSDLQDKRLFPESPALVGRIQIQLGESRFVLSQTNRQWRLEVPVTDMADQTAALALVGSLLALQTEKIEEDTSGEDTRVKEMQFQPVSTVEVDFGPEKRVFTVSPENISNSAYRVKFENTTTRYFVEASNMPPALVSMVGLLALHDKTMLSLPPASLRRISVKRENGSVTTVERGKEDTSWKVVSPAGKTAAKKSLDGLAIALTSLKADRIDKLSMTLEDLETYGFRKPWMELTLDVESSDAVRKTVLLGKSPGYEKRYAMVRGMDILFVLDAASLAPLTVSLTEP